MRDVSLEGATFLVADNGSLMRNIVRNILYSLRATKVIVEASGAEAVETLKFTPYPIDHPETIHLCIGDAFMDPIDGISLLRWLRRHEQSPDRFMPYMMMCGAADVGTVTAARDTGVTRILVKPFSVQGLVERIVHIANDRRTFVVAPAYLGPDRRHRAADGTDERRIMPADNIALIDKTHHKAPPGTQVLNVNLPNRLRAVLAKDGGSVRIYRDMVQAAERQLAACTQDYAQWIAEAVAALHGHIEALRASPASGAAHLAPIRRIANEMRSAAGVFDYPLIINVAQSLFEYSANSSAVTAKYIELINQHYLAIKLIIDGKVSGHGGDMGAELIKRFTEARRKALMTK